MKPYSGRMAAVEPAVGAEQAHIAADTLFRDGRITSNVFTPDRNEALQIFLALVDPGQHGSCGEGLERAVHGKVFIRTMQPAPPHMRIDDGRAKPPSKLGFG